MERGSHVTTLDIKSCRCGIGVAISYAAQRANRACAVFDYAMGITQGTGGGMMGGGAPRGDAVAQGGMMQQMLEHQKAAKTK